MSDTCTGTLLIIDDGIEHTKILISLLANEHEVFFCKNGRQGRTKKDGEEQRRAVAEVNT
ncbi:MAG: hypothetical protein KJ630_17990 [Proteobacteria bacterium]|nr:hypothetical protein [Pseudomonadota bacterium]